MQAISSPLLETNITGATGVLVSITASEDIQLDEIDAASNMIYEEAHPDANIIWGAAFDPSLQDEMRVTVIATGFIADNAKKPEAAATTAAPAVPEVPAAPASTLDDVFKKLEEAAPVEAVKAEEPVRTAPTASYDDIYGGAFTCITKNKKKN